MPKEVFKSSPVKVKRKTAVLLLCLHFNLKYTVEYTIPHPLMYSLVPKNKSASTGEAFTPETLMHSLVHQCCMEKA